MRLIDGFYFRRWGMFSFFLEDFLLRRFDFNRISKLSELISIIYI